jgi:hypothetical protein
MSVVTVEQKEIPKIICFHNASIKDHLNNLPFGIETIIVLSLKNDDTLNIPSSVKNIYITCNDDDDHKLINNLKIPFGCSLYIKDEKDVIYHWNFKNKLGLCSGINIKNTEITLEDLQVETLFLDKDHKASENVIIKPQKNKSINILLA